MALKWHLELDSELLWALVAKWLPDSLGKAIFWLARDFSRVLGNRISLPSHSIVWCNP